MLSTVTSSTTVPTVHVTLATVADDFEKGGTHSTLETYCTGYLFLRSEGVCLSSIYLTEELMLSKLTMQTEEQNHSGVGIQTNNIAN